MSQSLPIGNYQWIKTSWSAVNEIINTKEDSEYGYLIEADIEYPPELHDSHNDFPFLCEKMRVNDNKNEKLILNLSDRKNISCTI